ncbi:MAG: hypothetical protein KatS3mg110_3232 [Pirellulaceae bacterium]|nr:MAG: hypothetical protein KatS3mg110_3232 [Pirellulaceae bacterium]
MELEWLKKATQFDSGASRLCGTRACGVKVRHQCELLRLARSSYYYEPADEWKDNLVLMRKIHEQYTRIFLGAGG